MSKTFQGFPETTSRFLAELADNNDRDWFKENKHRYESDVLYPALDFIEAMAGPLESFAPRFRAISKRSGGSLMRVYRDTRFARDKRPYKTNIGIQFRHELGKDVHAPGYYVHIEPDQVFIGAGMWRPERKALAAIRDLIVDAPSAWRKTVNNRRFRSIFKFEGERLTRPPRGYDAEHEHIDDLKRKSFIAVKDLSSRSPESPGFIDEISTAFKAADPLMRFLCTAVNVQF